VAGSGTDDPHVRDALGLYLLGALKDVDVDRVERHLAQCAACCIEADALGAAVEPLAMVPPWQARLLLAELGAPVEEPHAD
jgi:predicted anti-sigma-YlaC factor YlaD